MRYLARLSIALAVLAAPSVSNAADEAGDITALLHEGLGLRRAGRDEAALAVFQRAFALAPTPIARAQVALAEQALGRWVDAEKDLTDAMEATDDAWIAKNRGTLDEARGEIARHLAWLRVDVGPATADVLIDGSAVALGADSRVTVDPHLVEVRARGHVAQTRLVDPKPGEHSYLSVVLEPAAAITSVRPPVSPGASPVPVGTSDLSIAPMPFRLPWGPLSVTAVGALGLGTSGYFGFRTFVAKDRRDSQCVAGTCNVAGIYYDSVARTSATISTIAFGVGIVAVATGVTWWILSRPGQRHVSALQAALSLMGGEAMIVGVGE